MTLVFFGLICSASFWHPAKLSVIKIISQWVQLVNYEAIISLRFRMRFQKRSFLIVKV